jgi:hypothetical protein
MRRGWHAEVRTPEVPQLELREQSAAGATDVQGLRDFSVWRGH